MSDSPGTNPDMDASSSRAERLAVARRGSWKRRAVVVAVVVALVVGASVAGYALVVKSDTPAAQSAGASDQIAAPAPPSTHPKSTTTKPTTTTTTVPQLIQPKWVNMPAPGAGISEGATGSVVAFYEYRLKALHFDPGPIDGVFDQDMEYAVVSVQKYYNLPRTGVIDAATQSALTFFKYSPALPNAEPDRVEIDLDRQTLTLFKGGQVALITTTSTGSGEHFCGGVDGCQYAITPTGHFHFYELHHGWQKGKLGTMWNPYYFNGSDAVHGLQSVPAYPASHGCARIPMHIADYFYTLVYQGMSVYVVGHAKQPGNGYVGPIRTAPTPPAPPVTTAGKTVPNPPTTVAHKPSTPTTVKNTPTTVKTTPTTIKKKP